MHGRRMVSIRLTATARRRLVDLAGRLGISQAAVVQVALAHLEETLARAREISEIDDHSESGAAPGANTGN